MKDLSSPTFTPLPRGAPARRNWLGEGLELQNIGARRAYVPARYRSDRCTRSLSNLRAARAPRKDRPMDIGRFDTPVRVALGGPGKISSCPRPERRQSACCYAGRLRAAGGTLR